jgi:hypothetical protein
MNVKNLLRSVMIAVLFAITVPATSSPLDLATVNPGKPGKDAQAAAQPLLNRLNEIKAMDKSSLTKTERKDLRNEVKDIKKELKANSRGIYLSIGAVVIIILLLILLL